MARPRSLDSDSGDIPERWPRRRLCLWENARVPEDHFGEGVAERFDERYAHKADPAVVDPIVDFLADRARGVPARVLARDASRAVDLAALPGVEVAQGDLGDIASLERALPGVDRVFLSPPPHPQMVVLQKNLIDAAARAGVRHIVHLSATCADENEPSVSLGGHGRGERDLEASGVSLNRPGFDGGSVIWRTGSVRW